jgi:amino-acid N-acetyltransferase
MVKLVKARLDDIPAMQGLVELDVKNGIILARSDDEVSTNIRSYILAKDEDRVVGYGALHIHSMRLAEIRSLIVSSEYRGQNIGKEIVLFALDEAKNIGVVEDVLVLTYLPDFFIMLGFKEIPKDTIPEHKIWTDCIKCIHFPVCNEVSLVYKIGKLDE